MIFGLAACGNRQTDDAVGSTDIAEDPEIVYVTEFVELEGAESIGWSNIRFVGDDLYYISYNWNTDLKTLLSMSFNRYSVPEGTTVEKELSLPEDASIDMWTIGGDGSLYAVLFFWEWNETTVTPNYTYMLAKYDAQGKELFVSDITDILNTEGSQKGIEVDGEGRIYISDNSSMWLFGANGEPAGRVGSGTGMGGRVNSFCRGTDGRVYVAITENDGNGSGTNLWAVNFEEKELEDICSVFPPADALCQNAEGNFVLYDGVSVYRYDVKNQEAEKLFAWLDCDMNGMYVTGFSELADAHPDAELFDKMYRERMLEYCLAYNMDSFVDWETGNCHFDTDEFKRLLQFVARFPDMKDVEDDVADEENQPSAVERIRNGEVLLCNTVIDQLDEIQYYVEMFDGPVTCIGYPNTDGRSESILVPFGTYAITSKSNVKEGAWVFLESYLTRANPLSHPGFPYSRSELEHMNTIFLLRKRLTSYLN